MKLVGSYRDFIKTKYVSLFLSVVLVGSFLPRPASSQTVAGDAGATEKLDRAELHQSLLDLTNPWTVMCVAAHPDDEDGSTLTVLRRKYGVHTVSLFSTYGEGGQNAVGPELYEDLGVIRARETMAAAKVQGSEPHFLGLRDFGFSKSADETFRAWGEREALRRMVFQIRRLRPDVIITNHDTTSGHGHHQATGRLILQAFDAAADPKQFPEQLKEVSTWQPQRLFVRAFRGPNAQTPDATPKNPSVTIDPNERDPIRGTTYAEQALQGLQQHATQGPWPKTLPPEGARIIRYNLVREARTAQPLPADAKTPLDGLHLPNAIATRFVAPTIDNKPLTDFIDNRGEVLVSLINARKRGAFTAPKEVVETDPQRFQLQLSRLDTAIAKAAGVTLEVRTEANVIVPAFKTPFEVSLANNGDEEIAIKKLRSSGLPLDKQLDLAEKLLPGTETSQQVVVTTPKTVSISVPSAAHLYDGRLFGEALAVVADLEIEGARFSLTTEKRIDVAPPIEIINNEASPCVETPATELACVAASLTLRNNLPTEFRGSLELMTASKHSETVSVLLQPNETQKVVTGPIRIPPRELTSYRKRGASLKVVLYGPAKERISETTLPGIYVPAVAIAGLRVGFVPSSEETLKHSLASLGVNSKELTVANVQNDDLSSFDTIIIDNRGYEAHPELIAANDKLLKFVENGGTLLVFYHKTNEWNPDERRKRPQLAPYPIILGDERVTEENAPIRILQPRHPLLNYPNRITQRDFAGWIQERGLYFPKEWDAHYKALLSTNDTGEKPLNGGLLVADYGKGHYIYTSMVWYRQLRAGIPGGYRFFANLISYGKRK